MSAMNRLTSFSSLLLCAALAGACLPAHGADAPEGAAHDYMDETPAQHDARMAWWREARFGLFIHWGLYAAAAGEWDGKPTSGAGEWIMNDMQIPLSQYARLVPQFNPVKFDANQWVRAAKGAGMRYIVITSKHHEGFAMYPSKLTDWCIGSTPFHRDPLKELADACRRQGIRFCFYHSIMDWHNPEYAPRKPWNDIATNQPDFDRYDAFLKGQLKELLTGYGPLGVLWFDGQWEDTWTYERGAGLYNFVRSLQPKIIVNDRVGTGQPLQAGQRRYGDYRTPEQTIPPNGLGAGVDWETCMTMNDTWGFKKSDQDWKSTPTLVRNLIDCASKGGNYLLNVGPTGEGLIPEASLQRLAEVGRWMKINGQAIYGTAAGPFQRQLPWGRCTQKTSRGHTRLYLHVFDWPGDGRLLLPGFKNKVDSAFVLATRQSLACANTADGLVVTVPAAATDPVSSTLVLRFRGAAEIETTSISAEPDGSIRLRARDAGLHGGGLKYESGPEHDNIGYWLQGQDWVDWDFKPARAGTYNVEADVAAEDATSFEVSVGGQTLRATAPNTGSYTKYETLKLGAVQMPSDARATLAVHPVQEGWKPMNLREIRLAPVNTNP